MKSKKLILASTLCVAIAALVLLLWVQPTRAAGPWYVEPGGNDGNSCLNPGAANACATINGAIGKASSGDTIFVATGTYTGTGTQVVRIDEDVTLSGGWNTGFTAQNGMSTVDGEGSRRGIFVNSSMIAIVERFVVRNGDPPSSWGGGIFNDGGTLTLNNSIISDNSMRGIYNERASLVLNNSTVSSNDGGIDNFKGTVTINQSSIIQNASFKGGGIITRDGALILNNSTVSGNTSSGDGGGIYGTIWNTSVTLNLNNSTVSGNSASSRGGGIFWYQPTTNLHNTVVAGNTADSGPDCSGTIGSAGYNLVGDTSDCTFASTTGDLTNIDAKLGPLQDNGGATETHALLPGSPAIDAGDNAACPATDQRGISRPQGAACDIGAYEAEPAPDLVVSKSSSPTSVVAGETLTYTIVFTNVGNANATGVRITDTLDSNITFQNSTPANSGVVGNQVYWNWGTDVSPNDPQVITVTALVNSPLPNGSQLKNIVNITCNEGKTAETTIATDVLAPEWTIGKIATPGAVEAGDLLTYTLQISNVGATATNGDFTVVDTIPASTTFDSATGSFIQVGNTITWTISGLNLQPNQSTTTRMVVQVDSLLTGSFTIINDNYRVFGANVYTGAVGLPVVVSGGTKQVYLPIVVKDQ